MSTTDTSLSSRQETNQLLHDIFAASKERLAGFDEGFDPQQQEVIKGYKHTVYDAFTQHNDAALFPALEVLLAELEKFELAYLQRKKERLQAEMNDRVTQALDALQHNSAAPTLEGVDVDASLAMGEQSPWDQLTSWVLPYEKRRNQLIRLHALQTNFRRKHEWMLFIEVVMLATCIGIMGLYLLNVLTTWPLLWYAVILLALLGFISSAWNWRSVA